MGVAPSAQVSCIIYNTGELCCRQGVGWGGGGAAPEIAYNTNDAQHLIAQ